ncbi:MAG: MoaD/ThiS family protein [Candidatus Methylomirabilales bacterium]
MGQTVKIPSVLRGVTRGQEAVHVEARTVGEALAELEQLYPGVGERLLDPQGEINRFVLIYINGEEVREFGVLDTPVADGDEITIIPALAGGITRR